MNWRSHSLLLVISTALAVGLFFIVPDVVAWWRIDGFKTPLRADMGDHMHYLTSLHRLQVEGVSGSSMFTWEHRNDTPRFPFFDAAMRHMPGFKRIPVMWWYVVLKFFSAVMVFLGLYGLFRASRITGAIAYALALMATGFYSPYAIQAPGLSSWFLALFLLGLIVFASAATRRPYSLTALLTSLFFLFVSGVHPVYLLTAIGMGGLWWFFGVWHTRGTSRAWLYMFVWVAGAVECSWLLFGQYIKNLFNGSGGGDDGFFLRNSAVYTHAPLFPLIAARLALLLIALWVAYRKSRTNADTSLARPWLVLLLLTVPAFFVNMQNIVTGFAFLGGHFSILEEFVVLPAVAMILFGAAPEMLLGSKKQKLVGVALLAVTGIFIASLTIDRPIRSWLVLGRWAPLIAGYLIMSIWLIIPQRIPEFAQYVKKLLPAALLISIVYAGVFLWRSYVHDAPTHAAAQQYREVFEKLSHMPMGVIAASPDISERIALYTTHRVYWSRYNGQFGGTFEELRARWLDESLLFEGDTRLQSLDPGAFSIFGAINVWCGMLSEKAFYAVLRHAGITQATLCNGAERDKEWLMLLQKLLERKTRLVGNSEWRPQYRLDWLLVDERKDYVSPEILQRYFEVVESVGDFTIYRYRPSAIN